MRVLLGCDAASYVQMYSNIITFEVIVKSIDRRVNIINTHVKTIDPCVEIIDTPINRIGRRVNCIDRRADSIDRRADCIDRAVMRRCDAVRCEREARGLIKQRNHTYA